MTKGDHMATQIAGHETLTGRVNADTKRIDRLKELFKSHLEAQNDRSS